MGEENRNIYTAPLEIAWLGTDVDATYLFWRDDDVIRRDVTFYFAPNSTSRVVKRIFRS